MGSETELKLALTESLAAAVQRELERGGNGTTVELDNTYYDTADALLLRHGMALRVRRAGTNTVQTLKTRGAEGALSRRGEWETPAPLGRPDPRRLAGTPLAALLRRHPRVRLRPLFTTRFTRTLWTIETPVARIEAALDSGWIEAGPRHDTAPEATRERLHELELELKQGSIAALPEFALRLQESIDGRGGLVPYSDSKATRGYRLATGARRKPVKANAAAFAAAIDGNAGVVDGKADGHAGAMDLQAMARAMTARATELLLANTSGDPPLDDAEFVHQARVAMRRLRSALRLLRDEVTVPTRCADGLRWIARELGRVRDLDVLALTTLPALRAALDDADAPGGEATPALLRAQATLERRRLKAAARLNELLRSRRYAVLVLRLLRWSTEPAPAPATPSPRERDGNPAASAVRRPPAQATLSDIAAPLLRAMHRRLARDAGRFAALPPGRQHRVRIRVKRLRYALDLCAAAVPGGGRGVGSGIGPGIKRLAPLVEALQDTLGELNDLAVLDDALPSLTGSARLLQMARERHRSLGATLAQRAQAELVRLVQAPWPWTTVPKRPSGARGAKPERAARKQVRAGAAGSARRVVPGVRGRA